MKKANKVWMVLAACLMMIGTTVTVQANFGDDLRDGILDAIRDNALDRLEHRRPGAGRQRLVLHLGNSHYRGTNTIHLRRELRAQYPGVRLRGADLMRVRLVAKSRHGRGGASLTVAGYEMDRRTIGGNPRDFRFNEPYTFDRVDLMNYSNSRGSWKIQLNGNIKIRKIVVIIRNHGGGGGGGGGGGHEPSVQITCSSINYQYKTCPTGIRVSDIQLLRQHSNSSCIYGQTYGFNHRSIWVDDGCRATFLVSPIRPF